MLDGREVRVIALTMEELFEISGINDFLESRPDAKEAISIEKMVGDVDLYIPLRGAMTASQVEPEGESSVLDSYVILRYDDKVVFRCCDGMGIQIWQDPNDENVNLGIHIKFRPDNLTTLTVEPFEPGTHDGSTPLYFIKRYPWDSVRMLAADVDDELREQFKQRALAWWNDVHTATWVPIGTPVKTYS